MHAENRELYEIFGRLKWCQISCSSSKKLVKYTNPTQSLLWRIMCVHSTHKKVFLSFLFRIELFFNPIFRIRTCSCNKNSRKSKIRAKGEILNKKENNACIVVKWIVSLRRSMLLCACSACSASIVKCYNLHGVKI